MKSLALLLITLPVLGLWLKAAAPEAPDFDRSAGIALARRLLDAGGLQEDKTANIAISGQKAAVAFTSPDGCAGAVLMAPLPPTAQRFDTVVTGLDHGVSAEGYVYRGIRTDNYPRVRVIAGRIAHALYLTGTERTAWSTTVLAYRELGQCGLIPTLNWTLAI